MIDRFERLRIIERLTHGIGPGRVLVQNFEVQLIGPPMLVCRGSHRRVSVGSAQNRALALGCHLRVFVACSYSITHILALLPKGSFFRTNRGEVRRNTGFCKRGRCLDVAENVSSTAGIVKTPTRRTVKCPGQKGPIHSVHQLIDNHPGGDGVVRLLVD